MDDRYEMLPVIEAERDDTYTKEPVMRSRKKTETKKPPELSSIPYGTVWDDDYRPGDEQMPYDREQNRKVFENVADVADFATDFVPAMPAVKKLAKGESPDALDLVDFIPGGSQGKAAAKMAIIPIMGARGMDEFITHAAKRFGNEIADVNGDWLFSKSFYAPSGKDEFVTEYIKRLNNLPDEARDNIVREMLMRGSYDGDELEDLFGSGVRFIKNGESGYSPYSGVIEISTSADPKDVASTLLHEQTHAVDHRIGDLLANGSPMSTYKGIGTIIDPVAMRFFPEEKVGIKNIKANTRKGVQKFLLDDEIKNAADAGAMVQFLGSMADARVLSPNNRATRDLGIGHKPAYRYKKIMEAKKRGDVYPEYAPEGLEGFANASEVLGEKGGETIMLKESPKWLDAYIDIMKNRPLQVEDEVIVPERFRY